MYIYIYIYAQTKIIMVLNSLQNMYLFYDEVLNSVSEPKLPDDYVALGKEDITTCNGSTGLTRMSSDFSVFYLSCSSLLLES